MMHGNRCVHMPEDRQGGTLTPMSGIVDSEQQRKNSSGNTEKSLARSETGLGFFISLIQLATKCLFTLL